MSSRSKRAIFSTLPTIHPTLIGGGPGDFTFSHFPTLDDIKLGTKRQKYVLTNLNRIFGAVCRVGVWADERWAEEVGD